MTPTNRKAEIMNITEKKAASLAASDAITRARRHVTEGTMASSAQANLDDASRLFEKGHFASAQNRACRSLAYSVGIFHSDHEASR